MNGEPTSSSAKQKLELAGIAMRGAVDLAGTSAADVANDQLDGAADRHVGAVALTEAR